MKKITLFLAMLIASFSFAQITIGTGNDEGQQAPFEPYYGYSYAQSIYTAAEINSSGDITGLQWYFSGTSTLDSNQDLTIFLGHTTKTEFTSVSDWEPIGSLTQVYSGGIDVSAGPGWVSIVFDTPFTYNGTDNLLVAVDENMAGYDAFGDDFHNSAVSAARSICYYSDSTNPDPAAPVDANSGLDAFVPNIVLDGLVASLPPNCDATLTYPLNGATDAGLTAPITWSAATGSPSGYKLTMGTTPGGTEIANALDLGDVTSYDAPVFTAGTMYYVTITPYNANGDATGCVEESFTTVSAPLCADNAVSTPDPSCGNYDVPLSWDAAATADGYYLTIGTTPGGTDIENALDLAGTNYTIVAPSLDTTYYWTVVPYNSAGSATGCTENTVATVDTGCYCTSETANIDGNGIGNLQVGTTDFPSAGTLSYEDFTGAPVDLAAGISSNVQITFETGYTYGVTIWIDFNDNFTFEPSEMVYSGGESSADNPTTFDASFVMPIDAALGVHRMRIGSDDTNADSEDPCNSSTWHVTMDVDVNVVTAACSPPVATATISPDCGSNQFFIDVDVTDLGDGTPEITDGVDTWAIAGIGITQVGPFASGDSVSLTITHGTDNTCDLALGTYDYSCPPVNDEPANAINLSVDAGYCDGINNNGDNTAATDSGEGAGSCFNGGASDDVWFTFTVPAGVATVDVSTDFTGGTNVDTEIAVYSGTPGAFTELACSQDDGVTILSNGSSYNSLITNLAVNIGETYYVQVAGYGTTNQGTFCLEVSTNTLGLEEFETFGFEYFPNPINDKLSLRAQNTIQNVSVYNMLGQEVIRTSPDMSSDELDMSNLESGAYFVQVTIQDVTETIRVIKK